MGKKSLNLDAVAFLLSKHKQALEDDDGDGDKKASDALSKAIDKVEKVSSIQFMPIHRFSMIKSCA